MWEREERKEGRVKGERREGERKSERKKRKNERDGQELTQVWRKVFLKKGEPGIFWIVDKIKPKDYTEEGWIYVRKSYERDWVRKPEEKYIANDVERITDEEARVSSLEGNNLLSERDFEVSSAEAWAWIYQNLGVLNSHYAMYHLSVYYFNL